MTTVTATEAKTTFLELLRGVVERGDAVAITHNGRPSGVLVSAEEWESLLETVSILSDAAAMRKIARARRELAAGVTIPHEQVWGKNGLSPVLPSRRGPGPPRAARRGRRKSASRSRTARRRPAAR